MLLFINGFQENHFADSYKIKGKKKFPYANIIEVSLGLVRIEDVLTFEEITTRKILKIWILILNIKLSNVNN